MERPEQEALQDQLRQVGLNRYEASVYLGLVTDQSAKVSEISKRTGVPQPKVYQALDALVEKGFCTIGTDAVNRYRPLPPRVAIDAHIARLRQEEQAVNALADVLEELYVEGRGKELWAPPLEIVKGVRPISRRLVEQIEGAEDEILFFGKSPLIQAPEIAAALHRAAEAGIRMRLLYEEGYLDAPEAPHEVEIYRDLRGERREIDTLPTKLLIVDRRLTMVSLSASSADGFMVLLLRRHGMEEHFITSFEDHWRRGRPIAPGPILARTKTDGIHGL